MENLPSRTPLFLTPRFSRFDMNVFKTRFFCRLFIDITVVPIVVSVMLRVRRRGEAVLLQPGRRRGWAGRQQAAAAAAASHTDPARRGRQSDREESRAEREGDTPSGDTVTTAVR